MSKQEIDLLQAQYRAAYGRWLDAIKEKLNDGIERGCDIEPMFNDGGEDCPVVCKVDKIANIEGDIMVHLTSRDYQDCDDWESVYDIDTSYFDSVLSAIDWED